MLLLLYISRVRVHVRAGREFHTVHCQLFTQKEEENLSIYVPHRSVPSPYIIVTRMPADLIDVFRSCYEYVLYVTCPRGKFG